MTEHALSWITLLSAVAVLVYFVWLYLNSAAQHRKQTKAKQTTTKPAIFEPEPPSKQRLLERLRNRAKAARIWFLQRTARREIRRRIARESVAINRAPAIAERRRARARRKRASA